MIYMASFSFEFKRGNTFIKQVTAWQDKTNNIKLPLTGYSFRSQIRNKTTLIATLNVSVVDEANSILELRSSGSTLGWPTPDDGLLWDIETTTPEGQVVSTETITFKCSKSITHDE